MNLTPFFKSVLEQDRAAIVLCNMEHEIIYMNPAAIKYYEKYGGAELLGKSLLNCHAPNSCDKIKNIVMWFSESAQNNIKFIYHNKQQNKDVYMVALRDDNANLIGYYEKHEYRTPESNT